MIKKLDRIYGLDALRAITMYLGVILHSTIAYKAGYHPRYWIKDPEHTSYIYDHIYFWIHSFRMPLFFLLSGFFTALLFGKIGSLAFLKNRVNRILVPLLVCTVTILPLSIAPFTFSRFYLDAGLPLHESIDLTLKEGWMLISFQKFKGLQHFWFLLNLFYFYVFYLVLEKLGFSFSMLMTKIRLSGWQFMGLAMLFTYGVQLSYYKDITPSIWTGLFPRNPQLFYYGLYFILGIFIFSHTHLLDYFKRNCALFIVIGTVISIFNVILVNNYLLEGSMNVLTFFFKLLFSIQNVLLSLGMIGICLKVFNAENKAIRYASDASYWVYIIHLFLVASFQILGITLNVYPPVRFVTTLVLTSLLAYWTYHLFVRYTIVGYYLHGKRTRLKNYKAN